MMRRNLTSSGVLLSFLFFLYILCFDKVYAQSHYMLGLNAGFAPSTHLVKSDIDKSEILSFHIGPYIGSNFIIFFDKHNRLSSGINYVQKGYHYREKSEFEISFEELEDVFDTDFDLSFSYDLRFQLKLHYIHLALPT